MQKQPARRNDGRVLKKLNTMEIKSTKDSLYLRGTQITSLPEGLTVGGSLYLRGTQIAGAQYKCGNEARAVYAYRHTSGKIVVSLGCFIGDEEEAVLAIRRKYGPDSEYEKKVIAAFEFARKRNENEEK